MSTAEKIDLYKAEVQTRNRDNFVTLALGGTIICTAITVIGLIMKNHTEFLTEYTSFLIYMVALLVLARYCQKMEVRHITALYYCAITPIMIGGILMGTFFDKQQPALTIMVLVNVMLLFLVDKPYRVIMYICAMVLCFCVCCYIAKERSLFIADLVDMLVYGSIAVGVNYFMQKMHIESVENFCLVESEAQRDSLTRLYNRGFGEKKTRKKVADNVPGAFLITDIDNFKSINDTYGHKVGDEAICAVAYILRTVFRPGDIIFRLGGDEFAVFAPGLINEDMCKKRFSEIQSKASKIKTSNENCNSVSLTGGWTIYSGGNVDFEDIYTSSDNALYESKTKCKGTFVIKHI